MLGDELFDAVGLPFGHHVDVQAEGLHAERQHTRNRQPLRQENQTMLNRRPRSKAIRDGRKAKLAECSQRQPIERMRRSHKRLEPQTMLAQETLSAGQFVELFLKRQSGEFAEAVDAHQATVTRDIEMLKAMLSNLPTARLQRSNLLPEVAEIHRELPQLRVLIVRDHTKSRLNAELVEHASQPLEPQPIHVRSNVVQTNEIASQHGRDVRTIAKNRSIRV